jgi:hypothetical protein
MHRAEFRATLQAAIDIDSTFAVAIANLANAYLDMNTDSTRALARKYAMRAILVGPKVPTGYATLASIAGTDKDYETEYAMASRALELDSTATMGWLVMHKHFVRLKDYPQMLNIEHKILAFDKAYAGAHVTNFYNSWLDLRMDSNAIQFSHDWLKTVEEFAAEHPATSSYAATLLFMLDDTNDPRTASYAKKLEVFTGNDDATYNYAYALCIYSARHHKDGEVRRFFDIGVRYCGKDWGIDAMRHKVMDPYANIPPFNKYVAKK